MLILASATKIYLCTRARARASVHAHAHAHLSKLKISRMPPRTKAKRAAPTPARRPAKRAAASRLLTKHLDGWRLQQVLDQVRGRANAQAKIKRLNVRDVVDGCKPKHFARMTRYDLLQVLQNDGVTYDDVVSALRNGGGPAVIIETTWKPENHIENQLDILTREQLMMYFALHPDAETLRCNWCQIDAFSHLPPPPVKYFAPEPQPLLGVDMTPRCVAPCDFWCRVELKSF